MRPFYHVVYLTTVLFLLIILTSGFCADEFVFIKSMPANVSFFTSDMMGNFYIVDKKTLTKYDENGNIVKTYDNKNLGDIAAVDVSNPMKILVYYKAFNQIVFLDYTLSMSGSPILLEELGITQSSCACASYDNAFWVFDNTLSRVVRYDKNLILQNQSDDLSQDPGVKSTELMFEKNNALFVSDPKNGVQVFDKYGTYNKTIPVKGLNCFQVIGDKLFYQVADTLKLIDLKTYADQSIVLPEKDAVGFQINNDLLYIVHKTGISIYKIVNNK